MGVISARAEGGKRPGSLDSFNKIDILMMTDIPGGVWQRRLCDSSFLLVRTSSLIQSGGEKIMTAHDATRVNVSSYNASPIGYNNSLLLTPWRRREKYFDVAYFVHQ